MDARKINLKSRFLLKQKDFILKKDEISLLKYLSNNIPTTEQLYFFLDIHEKFTHAKSQAIKRHADELEYFISLGIEKE